MAILRAEGPGQDSPRLRSRGLPYYWRQPRHLRPVPTRARSGCAPRHSCFAFDTGVRASSAAQSRWAPVLPSFHRPQSPLRTPVSRNRGPRGMCRPRGWPGRLQGPAGGEPLSSTGVAGEAIRPAGEKQQRGVLRRTSHSGINAGLRVGGPTVVEVHRNERTECLQRGWSLIQHPLEHAPRGGLIAPQLRHLSRQDQHGLVLGRALASMRTAGSALARLRWRTLIWAIKMRGSAKFGTFAMAACANFSASSSCRARR